MSARKQKAVSLDLKKQIIEVSAKKNNTELAKDFGIPRSTIIGILKDKEGTLQAINEGSSAKRARLKTGKHEELEQALVLWIKQVLSQNVNVTGELIKTKALHIATLLNIETFEASNGWLEGFKNRFSIKELSKQGEAGAIDVGSLKEWQRQILHNELAKFSPDDIFNADETALFWQILPDKTLAFKGDKCTGGKKSKERVTVLVGANMSGSEKLPLLVIGKSANPRCFKNAFVPVEYFANKKAWMTGVAFETWIKAWDKKLGTGRRKVLLYLDNCSAHPQYLRLSNITVKFLPPNTTAISQPMDQGIIQNLKVHYRRFLLRERIKSIDQNKEITVNLLSALHLLRKAWTEVKPSTIANCFRHAKFNREPVIEEEEDEAVDQLLLAWARLQDLGEINNEAEMQDYIHVDDEVITNGALTMEEILEEGKEANSQMAEIQTIDVDEEETHQEEPPITSLEATKAMDIVRRFTEKNSADQTVLKCSDILDEFIYKQQLSFFFCGIPAIANALPAVLNNPKFCGISQIDPKFSSGQVIEDVVPYSWPWAAVLCYKKADNKSTNCLEEGTTAAVVGEHWILTSIFEGNPAYWTVVTGLFDAQKGLLEKNAQSYEIEEVFNHPMYFNDVMYDIALIKTVKPIVFNKHVQPVCITADDTQLTSHNFSRAFNIGWDMHSAAIYPRLQQTPLNTMYYQQFPLNLMAIQAGAIDTWNSTLSTMAEKLLGRGQLQTVYYGRVACFCDWIAKTTAGQVECQN